MLEAVTVEALAGVTAAAAIGTFGAALGVLRSVLRTERAVFGSEHVDHDDGLIGMVEEHDTRLTRLRLALSREGLLHAADGGPEEGDDV